MTTFANQFKSEVSRLAKKEVKAETQSLKKATADKLEVRQFNLTEI